MGRPKKSKDEVAKSNAARLKRFRKSIKQPLSTDPLSLSTLASTSASISNDPFISGLPKSIENINKGFQPFTSRQAPNLKTFNPPQISQLASAKQNDPHRDLRDVVAGTTRDVETLAAPQPDPASASNILSVGLQSLAIRPRNAPSSPKKLQSPNKQATNIRQQSLASRSLAEQSIPARSIADDINQFENQPPSNAQRSAAESQTIRYKSVPSNLPTRQEDRLTTVATSSRNPLLPLTSPQQLFDISSTNQQIQSSLLSTSNNLNVLDPDDIPNDYQDGYAGSAEDTENERSLDSGVQSKANAIKRRSPLAQRAHSLPVTPPQRIAIVNPRAPQRTYRRYARNSSIDNTDFSENGSPSPTFLHAPVSERRWLPGKQPLSRSRSRTEQSDSDLAHPAVSTSSKQASDIDTEDHGHVESSSTDSEEENEPQLQEQIQSELQQADRPQFDCPSALARHLFAFQGCTIKEHTETDNRENPNHSSNDHVTIPGLLDFFNLQNRPSPIAESDMAKGRRAYEETLDPLPNWRALFTGILANSPENSGGIQQRNPDQSINDSGSESSGSSNFEIGHTSSKSNRPQIDAESEANQQHIRPDTRPKLCLLCSQIPHCNGHIEWDFDSFLGFAPNLNFARQGIFINTYPRFQQNISRSIHLFSNVTDTSNPNRPKVIKVPLHKVPHYYFGRIIGRDDISVYIFFPRMWTREKTTNFPGKDDNGPSSILRKWFDSLLLPALFRHSSPTSRQHFPLSWDHARSKAEAQQREEKASTSTGNLHIKALALHYLIPARALTAIWNQIIEQLPLQGNELYRDPFIYFSNLNTKLNFKSQTLDETWTAFNSSISCAINLDQLDRSQIYADLGKETVATDWDPSRGEDGSGKLPTTYLMRTCCQKSFARWAELGEPGKSVKAHFYTAAMLRDVTNTTLDFSRYCHKRNQGWVFSQAYSSFKELYDAANCKPFGSKFIQQLARDPEIDKMIRAKGRGGNAMALKNIWNMYFDSRRRLLNACFDAAPVSFGVREEHRLSFSFIDRLEQCLRTTGEWSQRRDLVAADYHPFWKLPSADWLVYLQQNCVKFTCAFEWIYTGVQGGRVPYEQCKVMIMLLQALPYTFDTGPDKHRDRSALWQTKFQRNKGFGKDSLGMGIKEAIDRCGYGWMLDLIDWERLAFRHEFASETAYADNAIRIEYRKNWKEVVQSTDDYARIEAASRWLELYQEDPVCLEFIRSFLLVNLMQIYRRELFRFIEHLVRPESQEQAKNGQIMFCRASFRQHFVDDWEQKISITDMRRTKTKLIQDLLFHMWGFNNLERKHWESLSFRALSKRACEIVEEHCGVAERRKFLDLIGRYFIATHWLFPRPTPTKFVQRNRGNSISFAEVYHRRLVHSSTSQALFVDVSFLLPTTINYPTKYRPGFGQGSDAGKYAEYLMEKHQRTERYLIEFWRENGRAWDYKKDKKPEDIKGFGEETPKDVLRRWRMIDWDFSIPYVGPSMSQIPRDYPATLALFDSDLGTITSALDIAWRAWQQVERPDEV